ncbi:MAG: RHS repeat domain-containing protein [Panacagrimonas sp.]
MWRRVVFFRSPIGMIRDGALYYIGNDQLGRPMTVWNTAKTVVWEAQNKAFDRTVTTDTVGGLDLGFPGQYHETESGNWYNLNRYYDATTGRYTQSDPIERGAKGAWLKSFAATPKCRVIEARRPAFESEVGCFGRHSLKNEGVSFNIFIKPNFPSPLLLPVVDSGVAANGVSWG